MPPGYVLEASLRDGGPSGWIRLGERHGSGMASFAQIGGGSGLRKVADKDLDAAVERLLAPGLEFVTVGAKRSLLQSLRGEADAAAGPLNRTSDDGRVASDADDADDDAEHHVTKEGLAAAAAEAVARGDRALATGGAGAGAAAIAAYLDGVGLLSRQPPGRYAPTTAVRLCCRLAGCHIRQREWWPAMFVAASGLIIATSPGRGHVDSRVVRATRYRHAHAAAQLGLLGRALGDLRAVLAATDEKAAAGEDADNGADHDEMQAVPDRPSLTKELAAVEARQAAMHDGSGLPSELRALGAALADEGGLGSRALSKPAEVARVTSAIERLCRTAYGRAALHSEGMLESEAEPSGGEAGVALAARRVCYKHVLYHASGLVVELLAARARAGQGFVRPTDFCQRPSAVCRPGAPTLLGEAELDTLRKERLVVVDHALDDTTIRAAARELEALKRQGVLWTDASDLCAPRTARHQLLLESGTLGERQREALPALCKCAEALTSVPLLLEKRLGLRLRVPQTVMVTCMPPGAAYKTHFDSHEGKDNPRLVTVLLYLAYDPPSGGALRVHPSPKAGASASERTRPVRDVYPHPGRLCVFMSQEVQHEVRPSDGERFAMQLWVWQEARDDYGR